MKRFHINVSYSVTLDAEDVWPDGDAPSDPTKADVMARLRDESPHAEVALRAWDIEPDWGDVLVFVQGDCIGKLGGKAT